MSLDLNNDFHSYIQSQYINPYFLSGVKKYIERGDVINIENMEFFVLNCLPENGFVNNETIFQVKVGLTKERCLEKIRNADTRYAMSLLERENSMSFLERLNQVSDGEGDEVAVHQRNENENDNENDDTLESNENIEDKYILF